MLALASEFPLQSGNGEVVEIPIIISQFEVALHSNTTEMNHLADKNTNVLNKKYETYPVLKHSHFYYETCSHTLAYITNILVLLIIESRKYRWRILGFETDKVIRWWLYMFMGQFAFKSQLSHFCYISEIKLGSMYKKLFCATLNQTWSKLLFFSHQILFACVYQIPWYFQLYRLQSLGSS